MTEHPHLRSYGRIKARTLKPRQEALLGTLLPHLAVPEAGAIELAELFAGMSAPSPLAGEGRVGGDDEALGYLHALTPTPSPHGGGNGVSLDPSRYILEIGFGGGEHLAHQAAQTPDARFIGIEPFLNGVASCLRHIEEAGVQNVRLHQGDARDVIARLPDACLDRVYILFPDPWPKTRHHKRRLIQPDFVAELARVMKPGAEVRFATDWANYAAWTLEMFTRSPAFLWTAENPADWRNPWPGHSPTRYEQKRLGDCAPLWLRFARRDSK